LRIRAVAVMLAVASLAVHPAFAAEAAASAEADRGVASFGKEVASVSARQAAGWILDAGDHHGMPFAIVDKVESKVFVFDGQGRLLGAAPALIGMAPGDESVPGIGSRQLSTIRPQERTTPAGRFVASMGATLHGDEILWVDYDSGVALHRVMTNVPKERRLQRLASHLPSDRRITYGCINVPAKFFDEVVAPPFRASGGIVYILPETRRLRDLFGSYRPPEVPPPRAAK
jgi:hypothetical protein